MDQQTDQPTQVTPSPEQPPATQQAQTDPPTPARIIAGLEAALVAERTRRQEITEEINKIKEAQSAAEQVEAEKRGEFEKLYRDAQTELETTRSQLTTLQKAETARREKLEASNTERAAALPEDLRALVPTGLAPDAVAEQLSRLEALGGIERPAGGLRSKPPKNLEEPIPEGCKAEALKYGVDPRTWFNRVWKTREERKAKRS